MSEVSLIESLQHMLENDVTTASVMSILIVLFVVYRKQIWVVFKTYVIGSIYVNKEKMPDESTPEPKITSSSSNNNDAILQLISVLTDKVSELSETNNDISEKFNELMRTHDNLTNKVDDLSNVLSKSNVILDRKITEVIKTNEFLLNADRESKKAQIVKDYNYFYVRLKKIDMYSFQSIERMYEIYLEEGGDTYIAKLMSQIRTLEIGNISTEDLNN